jgi:hypothetical protein
MGEEEREGERERKTVQAAGADILAAAATLFPSD